MFSETRSLVQPNSKPAGHVSYWSTLRLLLFSPRARKYPTSIKSRESFGRDNLPCSDLNLGHTLSFPSTLSRDYGKKTQMEDLERKEPLTENNNTGCY